jgi:hypothetical protein
MTNQITQKFIDLLGPISDNRLHFSKYPQKSVAGGYTVYKMSKVQLQLAEQLIKDHFKVAKVLWVKSPVGLAEDNKEIVTVNTFKLVDEEYTIYEGKTAYVYLITFSPKMYDPISFMRQPVKNGCTFGPVVYNVETFEPTRTIVLTFNPTYPQDLASTKDETEAMKQSLRDKLEQVLANPEEYMPEEYRVCMIRMMIK